MAEDQQIRFRVDAAVDTVTGLLAELLSPAPLPAQTAFTSGSLSPEAGLDASAAGAAAGLAAGSAEGSVAMAPTAMLSSTAQAAASLGSTLTVTGPWPAATPPLASSPATATSAASLALPSGLGSGPLAPVPGDPGTRGAITAQADADGAATALADSTADLRSFALPSGAPSGAPDPLLAWNQLMLDAASAARRGPTISSRLYALVNSALYDSWALFDGEALGSIYSAPADLEIKDLLKQAGAAKLDAAPLNLRDAVMAVAADAVFRSVGASLFSGGVLPEPFLARSTALMEQQLAALVVPLRNLALDLGAQVAGAINSAALLDGSNQQNNYADTTGYQPTPSRFDPANPTATLDTTWQPLSVGNPPAPQRPLTPQWGQVSTFAADPSLLPGSLLRPYQADGTLNPAFVAEINEVLNLSMNLTPTQRAIAEYWEAGPGSSFPPGLWMDFTNGLIRDRGLDLDRAVQLSFAVSQALMDASVMAWDAKFSFDSPRPITTIGQYYYGRTTTDWGDILTDSREQAIPGEQWRPYVNPTPAFPDVASGHSTFSAAASTVLRNFFGSNLFSRSISLSDSASRYTANGFDGLAGEGAAVSFGWSTLNGAADQAGFSRLLGGIHHTDGNWTGQVLGSRVGAAVTSRAMGLFAGEEAEDALYSQQFGTMASDVLTGLGSGEGDRVHELYGFAGNDTLIAAGEEALHLFGGEGVDRFRLAGEQPVTIRDFQAGETIEIDRGLLRSPSDLDRLRFAPSTLGSQFTDLLLDRRVLAHLDGSWTASQSNLVLWG